MTNPSDHAGPQSQGIDFGEFEYNVTPFRRNFGKFMTVVVTICALLALLPLGSIFFTVLVNGFSRLSLEVLTELPPPPLVDGGGFRNAIVGTLVVVLIGTLICVPVGVMSAIYTQEFGQGTKFAEFVRFCVNVLSGVPSIIAGLFAYGVVVLATGTFSAVAGGVALSVLMVPIVQRTTEEGLKSIPPEIRQAAVGVGATNFQTVTKIILPAALPFIATGVTLAVARAAGDTAPLLFTALFSQFDARTLWEPTATMGVLIYNFAISPYQNQQELAWVAALVILVFILAVSILARTVTKRKVF
jgi:phosphate transport system permease protein